MHRHRLDRLARLATGAALLGASALAGCNNEPKAINSPAPDPTPHPNATAEPMPSESTAASATPSARPMTHTMNAPAHVNSPAPSK